MAKQKFKTKLKKVGSWTIAPALIDTFKIFGTKKHIRVKGTIDAYKFHGISLMPFGDGTHFLAIRSEIRKAIKKESGDTVEIVLEKDNAEMEIPEELKEALAESPEATTQFESFTYSHKRMYVRYINETTKKETKVKRAVDTVIKLERKYKEENGKG